MIIKSSQERRKETEDLISAISKRIDVEETYAKGVEEAAKIIERAKQGDDKYFLIDTVCPPWPSPPSSLTV